jgi:hypothetical protein
MSFFVKIVLKVRTILISIECCTFKLLNLYMLVPYNFLLKSQIALKLVALESQ